VTPWGAGFFRGSEPTVEAEEGGQAEPEAGQPRAHRDASVYCERMIIILLVILIVVVFIASAIGLWRMMREDQ
jgi:hypothetical protein